MCGKRSLLIEISEIVTGCIFFRIGANGSHFIHKYLVTLSGGYLQSSYTGGHTTIVSSPTLGTLTRTISGKLGDRFLSHVVNR